MMDISAVIVSFNSAAELPACLESLRRQETPPREVILVDNASTDGTPAVAGAFPEVALLRSSRNEGFACAANRGVARARCEAVALMNADVELAPAFLTHGARALEAPDVAAAAAKILFLERPGVLNGVGGGMNFLGYAWDRGLNEIDRGQYDSPGEVFFASGGACFLRRSAFLGLGGFDPRFFLYHEDVDYCWRARLERWRIVTCPQAVAYHHYGASTRRELGWSRREILGERHNLRSLLKNYEPGNALRAWARILMIPLPPRRKGRQICSMLWNLAWLPDTLRHRRRIQRRRILSDRQMQPFILQSQAVPAAPAQVETGPCSPAVTRP